MFVAVSIIALQLFLESYTEFPLSTEMLVRPLQYGKIPLPMEVTLLGIMIEVRPLQPPKAEEPMDFTLLPKVAEVKPLQPEKA